jgi:hypothetical protein
MHLLKNYNMKKVITTLTVCIITAQLFAQNTKKLAPPPPPPPPLEISQVPVPPPAPPRPPKPPKTPEAPKVKKEKVIFTAPKIVKDKEL